LFLFPPFDLTLYYISSLFYTFQSQITHLKGLPQIMCEEICK
jgi:hypothetical protein